MGVVLSRSSSSNCSVRCCSPTPRPSTQAAPHSMSCTFMFFSTRGILRVHSCSGNLCFQWFLVFIVSHLTSSRSFNRFNVVTMCARSMFSFFVGHPSAMLYHNRFLDDENYSQCWSLWMSLICSKKRKKMLSSM